MLFLAGCAFHDRNVVGDEYIVKSVEVHKLGEYKTQYKIKATSLTPGADYSTFNGNKMVYYTNTFVAEAGVGYKGFLQLGVNIG